MKNPDPPPGVKFDSDDFAKFVAARVHLGDRYYAFGRSFAYDFQIFKEELSEGAPEAKAFARKFFVFLVKERLL
jgi:hypothetical protein